MDGWMGRMDGWMSIKLSCQNHADSPKKKSKLTNVSVEA